MKPSIQKLQKFFKLEAERGYDNKSVMGGLERMLERWEGEARLDGLPEDIIQLVLQRIRDYSRLTEKSRAETLQGLWKRIARGDAPAEAASATPSEVSPSAGAPAGGVEPSPSTPPVGSLEPLPVADEAEPAAEAAPVPASPLSEQLLPPTTVPRQAAAPPPPAAPSPRLTPRRPRGPMGAWQPVDELPALNAPLTVVRGIGPHSAEALGRLGIHTLHDALYYFPRRYVDYTTLKPINRLVFGEDVTVIGVIQNIGTRPVRSGKLKMTEAVLSDGSGALRINWFNNPWMAKRLTAGMSVSVAGKIDQYLGRLVLNNPEVETIDERSITANRIWPVYALTEGVTQRSLRRIMQGLVTFWAQRLGDPLPEATRQSAQLIDLSTALLQAHFPDSWDDLKEAQTRLAFDEIFLLQLGVMRQKRQWQARQGRIFTPPAGWLEGQLSRLPYTLTAAQQRALQDITADLATGQPMNRLVQGDVGSGKTVVAALAAGMVIQAGAQAAIMAPTGILAEQHFKTLQRLLAGVEPVVAASSLPTADLVPPSAAGATLAPPPSATGPEAQPPERNEPGPLAAALQDAPPVSAGEPDALTAALAGVEQIARAQSPGPAEAFSSSGEADIFEQTTPAVAPLLRSDQIALLVGATPEAEKRRIRDGLQDGSIALVIGTHALIEDPVQFQDLQLVVIDEQHRFGVEQRAALRSKGQNPHLLVMTATPIPRSLALTVYGDLDVTVIDEMPPGRQPVETYVLMPLERERAYGLIRSQVEQGRQAFFIYPLIEESDKSDAKAAVEEQARLQNEIFPRLSVGLLHGRMRPDEKDAVMEDFRQGRYHLLVSTTVVEVGVDIPNASVMIIEGANRFGLAQLHQLRGRVGRGSERSFCLLIPETPDQAENERLMVMAETNDGFVLAQRDLDQRGPGQFLGGRQSGFAELQFATLTDLPLIEAARREAQSIFQQDPDLSTEAHQRLALALQHAWGGDSLAPGDIS